MARTNIPLQALPAIGGAAITWTAADQANGMYFVNDGDSILMVRNTDASPHATTVSSVADVYGRTGDLVATPVAISGSNDGIAMFSRLPAHLFNQPGTNNCNVDFASATGMSVAVVQVTPRR